MSACKLIVEVTSPPQRVSQWARFRALLLIKICNRHELVVVSIPQDQLGAIQHVAEANRRYFLKQVMVALVASSEMIVRNSLRQVMDTVITDVSGEPLQDFWHRKIAAASDRPL